MLLATTPTASKSPSTTTRLVANAGLTLPATLALHLGLPPGAGTPRRQARLGPAPQAAQAGQLRLPAPGRPKPKPR